MSLTYTQAERQGITTAWAHLIDFAERHRMGDKLQLEAALKQERREVSSPTVAKALLLRTRTESVAETKEALWTLREAHRVMVAYGWHYHQKLSDDGVTGLASDAAAAHARATRRSLERMSS